MKAIVCVQPGRLERAERPFPEAKVGWVPVDIRAIGICGTDFHIFKGLHPFLQYPRVMGHELSGIVGEGSTSAGFPAGMRVVINPYIVCGVCRPCRMGRANCCVKLACLGVHTDGGMCERIVMPEGNLYPAGDLSLRDAAMIEFLAIGAHAVRRAELTPGYRVLVVGAGPIGVGTAIFARLAGGEVTFMDVSERRLGYVAEKVGLARSIVAGPDALAEAGRSTGGELFDVVFDATGNAPAMETSFGFVGSGGTLIFVGVLNASITFSDPEFHRREMKLLATRNATREDFDTVMSAVAAGNVPMDALNTHSGKLDDLPEAMPAWLASDNPPLKAIVTVP